MVIKQTSRSVCLKDQEEKHWSKIPVRPSSDCGFCRFYSYSKNTAEMFDEL